MTLSFEVMLGFLQRAIAEIKDPRLASNATRYSIKDTVLGAFSVFFMQCESFLEHQRQMHSRHGQDNALPLVWLDRNSNHTSNAEYSGQARSQGIISGVHLDLPILAEGWVLKALSLFGWTSVGDFRRHSVF